MSLMVRKSKTAAVVLYFVLLQLPTGVSERLIDGAALGNLLQDVANNALGADKIQAYFNELSYRTSDIDGDGLIAEVSSSLGSKFSGPLSALQNLKTAVESDFASFGSSNRFTECCRASPLRYDERFRHTVNIDSACVSISENSPASVRYPTERIEKVMKENYQNNPALKWQYLGTEDGILLNYPAFRASTCSSYDPRFRPFYVSSATPVEKDLVVIIDTSGSMGNLHGSQTLLQIAKEAATTVLQTLNPNDRFAVVSFSGKAEVLGSSQRACVRSHALSEATPINTKFFRQEINGLSQGGATNYYAALDKAFSFFNPSEQNITGVKREKAILFLTDGERTTGQVPHSLIAERNAELGNAVVILTYGLGRSLSNNALKMLRDIANQTYSNASAGEIKRGIFEHITDPSILRYAMGSYYNLFSKDVTHTGATFTVPYEDAFGLGLVTSLCLPVYKPDNSLYGVVCSDMTMSNLLSDITYFREGQNSYSFIIDGRGRTMMHPLLPQPSQVDDDPIYVNIKHLERAREAEEIIDSMKRGQSGRKNFTATRTVSRGNVDYEGIQTFTVNSEYYWTQVSDSNFSLCIVVGLDDKHESLVSLQPKEEAFLYHRRDLLTQHDKNCVHFNRFATKDRSAVMISPGGFVDPTYYLETNETMSQIQGYTAFLTGESTTNPGFKPSVINSVTATYKAEEIWRSNPGDSVIWRYIGTSDGVVRFYPAVQVPKNFDHTRRPWYIRSLAHKEQLVLSAPYVDQWGAGYLVTLSKVLTEPSSTRNVLGVMGTDFSPAYLYQTLISDPQYQKCDSDAYECFLVDNSGFVVIHNDFIEPSTTTPNLENVHIVYKNPVIANDLVDNSNMIKTHCIDFENIKERYTYRINIPTNGVDRINSYAQYEMTPIPNTNVLLVIQRKVYIPPTSVCCLSYGTSPGAAQCSSSRCGCLCYEQADYNYCGNMFELLADAGQTCAPSPPVLETESIHEENKIQGLPLCFDTECPNKKSKGDCYVTSGCSWCSKNKDLSNLDNPYCTRQENCYFGIQGLSICTVASCSGGVDTDSGGSSNTGVIAGIVTAAVVAVAVIGFIICCCRRQRNKPETGVRHGNGDSGPACSGASAGHANRAFSAELLPITNTTPYTMQSGSVQLQKQNYQTPDTSTNSILNPSAYLSDLPSYAEATKHHDVHF